MAWLSPFEQIQREEGALGLLAKEIELQKRANWRGLHRLNGLEMG